MTSVDTIVVGGGSAGCVLAARLSEDAGRRVLLVEAGPDHRLADLPDQLRMLSRPVAWPYDWGDQVESIRARRLVYARGRGLGGSSATNGGVAMRAEPPDLDAWPTGWRWDDLLPSFRRLERDVDFPGEPWHGDHGPLPIVRWPRDEWAPLQVAFHDGCVALGLPACADHNAPGTTGVGPIPMNREGRARVSNLVAYLEPARGRPNLAVRADAHVRRVVLERDAHGTPRAVGVELVDGEVLRAGEVVLCAGVVQDPLLLWRSGIGPADAVTALGVEPVHDLPAVGAHLTDHLVVTVSHPVPPDLAPEGAPSIQTILRATAPGSERVHDLQLTPFVRRHADGRRELAITVALQLPDGEGSITPTAADPAAPARIVWPFGDGTGNLRRLRDGWRLATRVVEATGLAVDPGAVAAGLALPDADLDELIAEEHTAFYHGCGTCRMGDPDEPDAVVDTDCSVRGVPGLRIVDASIIPMVPRSNTNIVVTAVAERAAELLRA